ncbi:NfeD family protein [Stakelama saccharophila]|uniref:NfeD family protein n=1 Tax=Stakelama saccharophila TaxID=3075605 RepID=A0ABZ0B663_9SPHN|nr:NfeD family protein [Stakelama sp. W311]WNO52495.1 NfeD family protein [Stakelama sp. W311]
MDWLSGGALWLIAAALLGIAELLIPGVFLVFVALAAAVTGILTLLFPELNVAGQLIVFAAWSVVIVLIGKRWYGNADEPSDDPRLNDRIARLIGETVIVTQAIENGVGRVRVGDGEWSARGPDTPAGSHMRITGQRDGELTVEPLSSSQNGNA